MPSLVSSPALLLYRHNPLPVTRSYEIGYLSLGGPARLRPSRPVQVMWPDRSEPGQPQNSAAPMLGKREGVQQRGGQTAEAAWADADAEEPRHKTLGRQDVLGLCLGAVSPAGAQNWSGEKAVLPRQLPSLATSCEAAEFSAEQHPPTAYCAGAQARPTPRHATPRQAVELQQAAPALCRWATWP